MIMEEKAFWYHRAGNIVFTRSGEASQGKWDEDWTYSVKNSMMSTMQTFKSSDAVLIYHLWGKCFGLLLFLSLHNDLHQSTHLHPTLFPDSLLASTYWRENSVGLLASEPRPLPLGGGLVGTQGKQGSYQVTGHDYQWPRKIYSGTVRRKCQDAEGPFEVLWS